MLDHGDPAAEASVRLGEFEADVAAAEDDEVLGQPVEFQQLDVRHRTRLRQARNRWDRAVGAHVEDHAVACQQTSPAVVQTHFEGLRRDETPDAHDQFGAAVPVLFQVHGDQAIDHVAFALPHPPHVDRRRACYDPELRRVVDQVRDLGAPDFVLAGQAVDVRARAADPFPFHDGRTVPCLGQVPGQELAARAAAQDQDFIALWLRHACLL